MRKAGKDLADQMQELRVDPEVSQQVHGAILDNEPAKLKQLLSLQKVDVLLANGRTPLYAACELGRPWARCTRPKGDRARRVQWGEEELLLLRRGA